MDTIEPAINVRGLSKTFSGDHPALDIPESSAQPGEMVDLIGASGSGKRMLLRQVAGLICADRASGPVRVQGKLVQGRFPPARHSSTGRISAPP